MGTAKSEAVRSFFVRESLAQFAVELACSEELGDSSALRESLESSEYLIDPDGEREDEGGSVQFFPSSEGEVRASPASTPFPPLNSLEHFEEFRKLVLEELQEKHPNEPRKVASELAGREAHIADSKERWKRELRKGIRPQKP